MEDKTIDRTPCNKCIHEEVCSFKNIHHARVQDVALLMHSVKEGLDIVYVSCRKFTKVVSHPRVQINYEKGINIANMNLK